MFLCLTPLSEFNLLTARIGIIKPRTRRLEFPLLIRSGTFLSPALSLELRWLVPAVLPPLSKREGISDVLGRGSIILVLTVFNCGCTGCYVMLVQAVLWRSENVKANGNIEVCLIADTVFCSSVGGCVAFDSVRCLPRVTDS